MVGIAPPATRRLVLLCGAPAAARAALADALPAAGRDGILWVAEQAAAGFAATPAKRVLQHLGSESRLLVFDAHQGFHPDAFAAAVGTLRGGGDCVLLAPPLDQWGEFADPDLARLASYPHAVESLRGHFLGRLAALWRDHPAVLPASPAALPPLRLATVADSGTLVLSNDQQAAVDAVLRVAQGHARRPLVLTADRGRGKSTVLGIAAARLLRAGAARVTVLAPSRRAAATLFAQALRSSGLAAQPPADIRLGSGELRFRLPADFLTMDPGDDDGLLLVDEAAAIPVAVLSGLLDCANRLVFATTVHGYEGSGRGFELRFQTELARRMPQWRGLHLTAPLRWAADDPLEALLHQGFLLDAGLPPPAPAAPAALRIEAVTAAGLAADEPLLRQTFGLLLNAHYQTRPSDLRQLLDGPDVRLWLARRGDAVVGALMVTLEGVIDDAMAAQILAGRRRPRGHLLVQSLAVHAGLELALQQRVVRIQRIAVDPRLRRQGIGRRLIAALSGWAQAQHCDALGCAFGIETGLLDFWQAAGFVPARLGVRVDPASAAHSLFLLRGLSAAGREMAGQAQLRLQRELPWALAAALRDLDSRLALRLLHGRDCTDLAWCAGQRRELDALVDGVRQPDTAQALLWKALLRLAASGRVAPLRLAPLLAWLLQHHPPGVVCREYGLAGRRELSAALRGVLRDHSDLLHGTG